MASEGLDTKSVPYQASHHVRTIKWLTSAWLLQLPSTMLADGQNPRHCQPHDIQISSLAEPVSLPLRSSAYKFKRSVSLNGKTARAQISFQDYPSDRPVSHSKFTFWHVFTCAVRKSRWIATIRPCSCEAGVDLCQMPSHADVCQVVSTINRVIMRLPWSSSPRDTCIRQAIFILQVAMAVCVSPSGAKKTWSLESRSVRGARYNDQRQPNNQGYIQPF
ncbi:hypothetical protein EDD15DRAFT_2553226 [Pisolithus albus]|nr:hypothetical protein EDD15DRAFT_2553226 [Pisolithus albus]